ncbi:MAG: STAS domain-containing protein [Cyclobacteriaceae bacterium]
MNYTHTVEGNALFIYLKGDLIGENQGPELMELINDHINQGVTNCAVDISEVRFINSSGIGVLITILTKFRNKEGEVVLIKPSEQVKKLLIITKLNSIFQIVDSKEDAKKNF